MKQQDCSSGFSLGNLEQRSKCVGTNTQCRRHPTSEVSAIFGVCCWPSQLTTIKRRLISQARGMSPRLRERLQKGANGAPKRGENGLRAKQTWHVL